MEYLEYWKSVKRQKYSKFIIARSLPNRTAEIFLRQEFLKICDRTTNSSLLLKRTPTHIGVVCPAQGRCRSIKLKNKISIVGGVHLGPLGTAGTNRPIVPAPGVIYDAG
jgi:hypothetical protein